MLHCLLDEKCLVIIIKSDFDLNERDPLCSSRHWWWSRGAADQVGSDAQVLPDGVLVLGGHRGLAEPRPLAVDLPDGVVGHLGEDGLRCVVFLQCWMRSRPSRLAAAAAVQKPGVSRDKRCTTQELPHDGVGLLQGLSSMGGVEEQPVDDVDLLGVVLSERRQRQQTHLVVKGPVCKNVKLARLTARFIFRASLKKMAVQDGSSPRARPLL